MLFLGQEKATKEIISCQPAQEEVNPSHDNLASPVDFTGLNFGFWSIFLFLNNSKY